MTKRRVGVRRQAAQPGSQAAAGCQRRNSSGSVNSNLLAEPDVVAVAAVVVDLQRRALHEFRFTG